jgi:hypothetical protein
VNNLGGSFYLAKDAIMNSAQFNNDFNKEEFLKHRNVAIKSEQSVRLKL